MQQFRCASLCSQLARATTHPLCSARISFRDHLHALQNKNLRCVDPKAFRYDATTKAFWTMVYLFGGMCCTLQSFLPMQVAHAMTSFA